MEERSWARCNALTVDVEDYFQVLAMAPYVGRDAWERWPCRIEASMDRLLQICADRCVCGTFFTLGWVAKRYPQVVRRIVAAGHELASHGYGHERVWEIGPRAFREDLIRAKGLLEDTGGVPVVGYRAPAFSIGPRTPWAREILQETGHRYSSSVYPVRHDHYGTPEAPRHAHRPDGQGGLLELPPATLRLLGRNLPAGGGGYFRLLPYRVSWAALRWIAQAEGQPAVFYIPPWELDPEQPRVPGIDLRTRVRHYVNLHRTEQRLSRLLQDLDWDRIDRVFAPELAGVSDWQAGQAVSAQAF
ncbi:XrtA system polysaccharide deacetylase [Halorhodospira halophila]|uniref:XrtA system polysaccharide deacetylase n=1 Tax=Halorhodospira halophila TaxID=1053 RepID=UPI001903E1FF|nr:XrtA system polysaccharide deacetylase [Halorhodospira halophila]MBK1729259.1 polysaccharide deacetylase family protein [Halorhodospira halophila]